jgi:isopentenyl-diphosphate delta-isomerase
MEEEMCVGVTFDDKPLKPLSKKDAHLVKNKGPILHRAFSVFLFDEQGRLLLQRRAASKITFPLYWTNTCCSHPLWNRWEMGEDVEGGKAAKEEAGVVGCKRAAIRKLEHELGIPASALTPEELIYSKYVCWLVGPCGFVCPIRFD